jgi:lipid A disaccharide synthetase
MSDLLSVESELRLDHYSKNIPNIYVYNFKTISRYLVRKLYKIEFIGFKNITVI